MTLKEAVLESVKPYPIRENLIVKTCIEFGLDPQADYSEDLVEKAKRVELQVLKQYSILSSSTQGGSRIVFRGIKYRILRLIRELGEDTEGYAPTVEPIDL